MPHPHLAFLLGLHLVGHQSDVSQRCLVFISFITGEANSLKRLKLKQ